MMRNCLYQADDSVPLFDYLLAAVAIFLGASAVTGILQMASLPTTRPVTLLWLMLYALTAIRLLWCYGAGWLAWSIRYRLLLHLLLLGAVVSVAWSIDSYLSLQRVVHLLGTTLVGFYLGFHFTLRQLLKVLSFVLTGLLLISVMTVIFLPDIGLQHYEGQVVWKGVVSDKNTLGFLAVVAVLVFFSMFPGSRMPRRILLLAAGMLALMMLLQSRSATSLLALVVAGGVTGAFIVARNVKLSGASAVILLLVSAGLLMLFLFGIDSSLLFTAFDRSSDLTGRQEVWARVMALVEDHIWLGTGYGTLWAPTEATEWQQQSLLGLTWTAYHAHNGFLQVASQLGLPIALLATLFALQLLIESVSVHVSQPAQPGALMVVAFQIAFIVTNIAEAQFLMDRSLFWMLEIALPIALLREIEAGSRRNRIAATAILRANPNLLFPSMTLEKSVKAPLRHAQAIFPE